MWAAGDVTFELDLEGSSHPVVLVKIGTPLGEIQLMAEPFEQGRVLRLLRTHVQSDAGSNAFGIASLRRIAEIAMERMDYDEIIVEGALRTTGANPGRAPQVPFRFRRRDRTGTAPAK